MLLSTTLIVGKFDINTLGNQLGLNSYRNYENKSKKNDWENWGQLNIEELIFDNNFPWEECTLSINQDAQFVVVSRLSRSVIIEFDPRNNTTRYHKIHHDTEEGSVTQVRCLDIEIDPQYGINLKKHKKFIQTIVFGFSTGIFKICDRSGYNLLTEHLDNLPISQIKTRTNSLYIQQTEQSEELIFLHGDNVLVCIDGHTLFHNINSNFVKRKQNDNEDEFPIKFRKWKLSGQKKISDFISCGIKGNTEFSILFDYQNISRFFAVGHGPFISGYLANEQVNPLSSAVTKVFSLASTIKNSFFSFATGIFEKKNNENEQAQKKFKQPVEVNIKWKINDVKREVNNIYASPNSRFAALTDNFGRVLLLDTINFLIIRMWKGYRDAQCAWIEIPVENSSKMNKESNNLNNEKKNSNFYQLKKLNKKPIKPRKLVLVIYAPIRNLIEVWGVPHKRIRTAFKVKPNCRLISNYGLLGSTTQQKPARAFIMEQATGNLSEIMVQYKEEQIEKEEKETKKEKKEKEDEEKELKDINEKNENEKEENNDENDLKLELKPVKKNQEKEKN
ncbi:rab3-gap regulatory domain [Anaeramoeba flamelloides]|uniref:Rab3-gap regulatory domain n=1 Tax=Anaeramoeba flamelloides TaxID=1746091 RepID=A0AAV7Y9B5_9EUKA|nr:rab3-gap regulatory domain [Anaeramoeba flamelloides]